MRVLRSPVAWLMVCVTCLSGRALANDTAVEGAGGSIKAMEEHPSVLMRSEHVEATITPEDAAVHCAFVFENRGPATRVKMGFPEGGGEPIHPQDPKGFRSFCSWVDAEVVPAKIEGLVLEEYVWHRWRTKVVPFAAGQTRRVEVRYEQALGEISHGPRFFSYRFDTGASWKGKIDHAKLVVHFADMKGCSSENGGVLDGTDIVRTWADFEPAPEDNFFVEFHLAPPPVVLNGKALELDSKTAPLPRYSAGHLFLSVRWLAEQIGATVTWDRTTRTGSLRRGGLELALAVRRASAEPTWEEENDPEHRLRARRVWGRIEHSRLVVSGTEVVKKLGGTVDARFDKLTMALPPLVTD